MNIRKTLWSMLLDDAWAQLKLSAVANAIVLFIIQHDMGWPIKIPLG